ncbi:MAG: HNH endonuclease family protein [Bdellovibrionota bacterium]
MMKYIQETVQKSTFAILVLFFSSFAIAGSETSLVDILKSDEDFNYSHYYTIEEDEDSSQFDLLIFSRHAQQFPLPLAPYKRDIHFGGWLRDSANGSCLNTRAKVLARDSLSPVTYTPNACAVATGQWDDPYTANLYSSAKDIQIDHVVALKNAYMTGAHQWDFKKRCLYANYQGNNFHLLSVDGPENMKKSDHSPGGYTPPNQTYTCEYIKNWLNIKLIWSLRITPKEASAINKIISENDCEDQDFIVSAEGLKTQRDFMSDHANLCDPATMALDKF